jgi:hypothetical protein
VLQASTIRSEVEAKLSGRIANPFAMRTQAENTLMLTGIASLDALTGGIPCGAITEIVGSAWCSAGRKSLETQLLATATREHYCALVDATDSFDPKAALAAGVIQRRLLWIRCGGRGMKALEEAFKSADLLLQGSGGFGLLVVDLTGIPERFVRRIPLSTWFRFRGVVEKLPAPLVFVTPCAVLGTCSHLTLHLSGGKIRWSQPAAESPTHARLVTALDFEVQVANQRSSKKPSQKIGGFSAQRQWA